MLLEGRNLSEIVVIIGVFTAAAFRIMPSLTKILNSTQEILYNQPVLDTFYNEIKNLETDTNKIIVNKSFNPDKKLDSLEVEDLGFNYDDKKVIFKSVNIKLEKGLVYGICGPSGSGKSTFINLLLGFLKPNKGKIKFNNKIISENLREWRNNIGFVPQDIFLFDGTIKDNILLHLPENQLNKKDLDVSIKNANLDNL